MPTSDRKLRIALAVFKSQASLSGAVDAFAASRIPLSSLGLIVLAPVAAGMLAAERTHDHEREPLATLLAGLVRLDAGLEQETLASPHLKAFWRDGIRAPGFHTADGAHALPRLAPDLERHIRAGAAILTVVSPTPAEHWHRARLLLAQSCTPILALECSLPPAI